MRVRGTDREETYGPMRDKTLANVLRQQFITEFGYADKVVFAEVMVDRILETIAAFSWPQAEVRPGQLVWMAVANDGNKHAKERMRDTPQVPVVLNLITDEELAGLQEGKDYKQVRRERMVRLLREAYAQGGVLAQSDLASILLWSGTSVGTELQMYQRSHDCVLPYRGTVQDIGGTVTHKVEVIRLFEAGVLEPQISEHLDIPHNLRQVENYVQTYKNVLKLLEHGCPPTEIAGILSLGQRLIDTYLEIVRVHHPDVLPSDSQTSPATADSATR